MKKIIFLFLHFFYVTNSLCSIGCMDNSYHMKVPCDFKNYHYVRCECPCTNVIDDRGVCRRCYHRGNPARGEINSRQLLNPLYVLR